MIPKEITIELDNMDVVLSVSTASAGSVLVGSRIPQSTAATSFGNAIPQDIGSTNVAQCLEHLAQPRDARRTEYLVPGSFLNDPVVERLVRALEAAEQSTGNFDDVYADAVRLAIVTRLLSLRSESERSTETARNKVALPTWRLKRVIEYVNSRYMDTITLANLASAVGLSRMHFAAQFRLATGIRPHEFVLRHRIERSQKLLAETGETLVNIALSVGFQSQSHFTTVFKRYVGDTPHRWRCRNGCARRQQRDRSRIPVEPLASYRLGN